MEIKTFEDMHKRLEEIRIEKGTLDIAECTEMLSVIFNEIALLMGTVLFGTPNADNYLKFMFSNETNPEFCFNVILQKKGGKLPPEKDED